MKKEVSTNKPKGFSIIETLLAVSILGLIITAVMGAFVYMQQSSVLSGNRNRALLLAEEGLEATRNIRDSGFENLTTGTHGLDYSGSQWAFSGSSESLGPYTRQIEVVDLDSDRKQVTATVTWQQNEQRTGVVSLVTYLNNWAEPIELADLIVDTSGAVFGGIGNEEVQGITIENTGLSDLTIDKMTLTWGNGRFIQQVQIDALWAWQHDNEGAPDGKQATGVELDIVDYVLVASSGPISINKFAFDGDMNPDTFSILFTMSDERTKQVNFALGDLIPPSNTSDLDASNSTENSIDLDWTAPGDDGVIGTATSYDLRYSTNTINEGNWAAATQVAGEPTPLVAGSAEAKTVSGLLENTTYYFALKTSDEMGNISRLSNVPNQATLTLPQADGLVVDYAGVTIDLGDNTRVINMTLQSSAIANITLDSMTINWSDAHPGTKGKNIDIDGVNVWSGTNNNGALYDITDVVISNGEAAIPIDFIEFSKNMTGATLDITFTMGDASTKVVNGISP